MDAYASTKGIAIYAGERGNRTYRLTNSFSRFYRSFDKKIKMEIENINIAVVFNPFSYFLPKIVEDIICFLACSTLPLSSAIATLAPIQWFTFM